MNFRISVGKNRKMQNIHSGVKEEALSRKDNIKEEQTVVLEKLVNEEANLIEEKKNLVFLREKLRLKVQEEIESKKKNIKNSEPKSQT